MNKIYQFQAEIKAAEQVDGAYVEFPYNTKEEFGTNGIIKVSATFNGYPYRGALVKMGTDCHIIGITKAIRSTIKKEPGDIIEVVIQQDTESRAMEVPQRLIEAWENEPQAEAFFKSLSESQQNKFILSITSAKKEETLAKRIEQAMELLKNGIKMK